MPLVTKGGHTRSFDAQGLPLCKAGLPMPLKLTYLARKGVWSRTRRAVTPVHLLFPEPTGETCPIDDPHWAKGGCITTLATSIGARIRSPTRPRRRGLQGPLQAAYRHRTDQRSGHGPGHRTPQAAQRGRDRQPQHPDLCPDQPARAATRAGQEARPIFLVVKEHHLASGTKRNQSSDWLRFFVTSS